MIETPVIVISSSCNLTGKTTLTLNLSIALQYNNYNVRVFAPHIEEYNNFLQKRKLFCAKNNIELPMLEVINSIDNLFENLNNNQVIIADIPSCDNDKYAKIFEMAHTIITTVNDKKSIDWNFSHPYINLIWNTKKVLAAQGLKYLNWVVVENEFSNDKENISELINMQSKRYGFRIAPTLKRRLPYICVNEGYSVIDLQYAKLNNKMSLSDLYARREILNLADFMWKK